MVLTDYGKKQYSKGELEFKFYAFSDDEVDYDPYISNSASLNPTELTASKLEQVESTLVREAVFGLHKGTNKLGKDQTNIRNLLFSMPQGQKILPLMVVSPDIVTGSVETNQQLLQDTFVTLDSDDNLISKLGPFNRGFDKFGGKNIEFESKIADFFDRTATEGYQINIFISGSDGLIELDPKRDLSNNLSYQHDLRLFRDNETKILKAQTTKETAEFEESIGFERIKK
ncbi:MAG: hypothetical protein ACW99G_04135 [Candidatus Thorarchaeota archaeon]|jgi:hypothetical protein